MNCFLHIQINLSIFCVCAALEYFTKNKWCRLIERRNCITFPYIKLKSVREAQTSNMDFFDHGRRSLFRPTRVVGAALSVRRYMPLKFITPLSLAGAILYKENDLVSSRKRRCDKPSSGKTWPVLARGPGSDCTGVPLPRTY